MLKSPTPLLCDNFAVNCNSNPVVVKISMTQACFCEGPKNTVAAGESFEMDIYLDLLRVSTYS